jgi:hypothetical protein
MLKESAIFAAATLYSPGCSQRYFDASLPQSCKPAACKWEVNNRFRGSLIRKGNKGWPQNDIADAAHLCV